MECQFIGPYPDVNIPKWYKKWMRKIEEPLANSIFDYLKKNKQYFNSSLLVKYNKSFGNSG
jgi:hypothetical protein